MTKALVALSAGALWAGGLAADAGAVRSPADRSGAYISVVADADRPADSFAARHVTLVAHRSPRTTWGKLSSRASNVTFTSRVTCLRVDGKRAVVGGVITQSPEGPNLVGWQVFVALEDIGDGIGVDQVSAYFVSQPPGTETCDTATVLYESLTPVTSGDVRVSPAS